jgi:titin
VIKTVSAGATDRSSVVTGLTNGTAYPFSIVATNSVGNSVAVVSKAVTPSTTPGAATIGTTAQTSATSLTVNWTAPTATGGSAITGYEIKVFSNGVQVGAAKTAAATAKSLVVTGLTTKTAYTFTVAAKNVNGTGSASAASAAVSTK